MSDQLLYTLTVFAAVGSGLNAGLFFIFSNTVMQALGQLTPTNGIAAMQAINRVILNPVFFIVFFGTAIVSLIVMIMALLGSAPVAKGFLIGGAILYLGGNILVTITCNVPMNEALDKTEADSSVARELWAKYLVRWTVWNHVRTIACTLALTAFALAIHNL